MSIPSDYWNTFQVSLFPHLETVLEEPLTQKLERFIYILDVVGIEKHVASPFSQWMGRKQSDRRSIVRAFLAKAVYDHPTTEMLLENLRLQPTLRQLCGFGYQRDIPSAATFSRAFAEFAALAAAQQGVKRERGKLVRVREHGGNHRGPTVRLNEWLARRADAPSSADLARESKSTRNIIEPCEGDTSR